TDFTPITPSVLNELRPRQMPAPNDGQLWVLVDRADKADDNAEHLYRYLQHNPQAGVRTVFVLEPSSPDWGRLQAAGFDLVAFGSEEHRRVVRDATIVASSQGDLHIRRPFPEVTQTYRFVF